MTADRHDGRQSRGGVPDAAPLEQILAFTDSELGAFVVSCAGQPQPRRELMARFEALGRLVRAAGAEEQAATLYGRRPKTSGKGQGQAPGEESPTCEVRPALAEKSAASGQPDEVAGRSTVEGRDRPRRSGSRTGATRERNVSYASDVTGGAFPVLTFDRVPQVGERFAVPGTDVTIEIGPGPDDAEISPAARLLVEAASHPSVAAMRADESEWLRQLDEVLP